MKVTRRQMVEGLGALTFNRGLGSLGRAARILPLGPDTTHFDARSPQLAGTELLTREGDLAVQMVDGIRDFLAAKTASSLKERKQLWNCNYASREAYELSTSPNRVRFRRSIGLMDTRVPASTPSMEAALGEPAKAASGDGYDIYSIRLPVLDLIDTEGLLLKPTGRHVAQVVALSDADWTPEMLVGLQEVGLAENHFARRLAENGCLVFVPTLINRQDTWSGNQELGVLTNLTHREYIYRMSYEIGRHIIGYEIQRVLAAVDWFEKLAPSCPIGVIGYGEGGLLALYSGAADTRIDSVCVSGYFTSRQTLSQEPLYRNVWGLLHEFGDAELAGLIAPRTLVIEAALGPEIPGPPAAAADRRSSAADGRLVSSSIRDTQGEVERARIHFERLGAAECLSFTDSFGGKGHPEPIRLSAHSCMDCK